MLFLFSFISVVVDLNEGLTLFGHTIFQFNQKGEKKVDNSGGLCSMGDMSEGKERIVAEHPKAWVVRMVQERGLAAAEKAL